MNAYIGFACTTIFHYVHFKNIAESFKERAIFIIATPRHTNQRYEKLADHFEKNEVVYCDAADIISGRIRLAGIVVPYFMPLFNFIDPAILRIRVLYGYAKDAWNYAEWNRGFDLILAYGPYSQRRLETYAPTLSVGHPRLKTKNRDESVHDIQGRSLRAWKNGIPERATVLYCPTWGDLTSYDWFKTALQQLLGKYNVMIKLHHGISLSKDFSADDVDRERVFICDESVDLFDLFPVSDLVISDYSGAIFDAMLTEKRMVLINSIDEQVTDTGVLNIRKMSNIASLPEGSAAVSLDIRMRGVLASANSPSELTGKVGDVLAGPAPDYKEINADLYSHQDEHAAERIKQAIDKIVGTKPARDERPASSYIAFDMERLRRFVNEDPSGAYVVWGAGDYGQLIASWLVHNGYDVKAILDKESSKIGKDFMGRCIRSPFDYEFAYDDRLIVSFSVESIGRIAEPGSRIASGEIPYVIPF
ncbi:CDP-Glycerol:Poly(glycerophosphate) glycerophosphotransferase [Cohnella sp. OV330]|uniref:CDP-glycerol glycerophosphotransferase family protein n=1 Tax=Cohnella sp. OV330 TaxID=1855288 RepID=UPI0008F1FD05|nr:CDP-glycerol glycerophosphotransferase family protein [Cohnella sp. OV330]SFB47796.1 CDP-Glycerol:Poly(glycerophosphate) glycerophosphotransferase [Cohnella sp. OV330]